MTRLVAISLFLALGACSSGRTASCQQLFDCCHGNPDCDPIVDQNDPGACQTQLVVTRGGGMCHDTDAGSTATLTCASSGDAGTGMICSEARGPSAPSTCPAGSSQVASCTSAGEVGRCTLTSADGSVGIVHFYAPTTASAAMSACSSIGGTFAP